MSATETVVITFGLDETEFEDEERLRFAKKLLPLMRKECDAFVERVERAENLNPEAGSKPGIATLIGLLTAEVGLDSIKEFIGFLGDRMGDQPMTVTVGEVTITARSRHELEQLEPMALRLLDAQRQPQGEAKNA